MAGHSRRFRAAGHSKPKFLLKCGGSVMIEHVIGMFSERDNFHLILNKEHCIEDGNIDFLKKIIRFFFKENKKIYTL